MAFHFLSKRNEALGNIPNWSIARVQTCPGMSSLCFKLCYMKKLDGIYRLTPIYERNYLSTFSKAFFERKMILDCMGQTAIRIHVEGDFYSSRYIDSWRRIAEACPTTIFLAYTRSWNVPKLVKALESFRALPNVRLYASWDETMPNPPIAWRIAGMGRMPDNTGGSTCLKLSGLKKDCEACMLCMRYRPINIHFPIH